MSTRTGRVVRTVRGHDGAKWAVVEPHLSAAEVEREADAIVASVFTPDEQRQRDAEALSDAIARVRARRATTRRTPQMVHQRRVYHRPPDWCSAGGCPECDERVRP